MSNEYGFYIQSLVLKGPRKQDAELRFEDGLNVVSGASDTGKSYALSCIDFAFGAGEPPSPIPEASGYDTVCLSIIARKSKDRYLFNRGLAGGDIKLTRFNSSNAVQDEKTISAKHSPTDPDTISGVLLGLAALYGKQVRTNKQGKRRSLSFRDLAFLSLVDEERIIAKRPPQLSGSYIDKTVEGEVFRLLVTGQDSGVAHAVPTKKQTVGVEAKMELIGAMIMDAEARLKATGISADALETELNAIEKHRNAALAEYEGVRLQITEIESQLGQHTQILRQANARQSVIQTLENRFTLLDQHYNADTIRLAAIEESGRMLDLIPSKPCPVCGSPPDQHKPDEQFQPECVEASARAETVKIRELRKDLAKVLTELAQEKSGLTEKAQFAKNQVEQIQATLQRQLMPRVKESLVTLQAQTARRDTLLKAKGILDQLAELREHESEFAALAAKPKTTVSEVTSKSSTAEMDEFAESVQKILAAWKYPGLGRVVFSEDDQDLVISGQPRISHGKGVRALTCAAFIVGLLHHCKSKQLAHPSLVVLDSPLVAYREPDSAVEGAEDQQLRKAGVKEAFYESLAQGLVEGQVIVFENEDPPTNMAGKSTRTHFSKNTTGRYGFLEQRPLTP
jgi:hypothetical protein